ncbi:MAG: hypothetical protein WA667_18575, partial [Candidatus Nitrosopolaris sp.]
MPARHPDNSLVYVADYADNKVTVLDGDNDKVLKNIDVGTNPYAIDLNPKTKMIYLANVFSDYGSLLNGTTNSLSGTIPLGTSE